MYLCYFNHKVYQLLTRVQTPYVGLHKIRQLRIPSPKLKIIAYNDGLPFKSWLISIILIIKLMSLSNKSQITYLVQFVLLWRSGHTYQVRIYVEKYC